MVIFWFLARKGETERINRPLFVHENWYFTDISYNHTITYLSANFGNHLNGISHDVYLHTPYGYTNITLMNQSMLVMLTNDAFTLEQALIEFEFSTTAAVAQAILTLTLTVALLVDTPLPTLC